MRVTRRQLFALTAGAGAAATVSRYRAFASPAIVAPEITPQQFGATGNAETDSAGWTEAVKAASAQGRPVVARGTFILRAPSAVSWNWQKQAKTPVHVSVPLLSNTAIQGDATILVGKPEQSLGKFERHLLFGTGLNERVGTLTNISFDGLTFDFRDEFGPPPLFTYAIGVTGVDDFKRSNLKFVSTSKQAGRCLLSENVRGRTDSNIMHRNIGQGIYVRYEHNVTMSEIAFEDFNEALDFDGPCWDVLLEKLSFRRAHREAQCIDTGGGARWVIRDVTAEDTGAICYIYTKAGSWPGYSEWLNKKEPFTPDYVPPQSMKISNVKGTGCGGRKKKGEALLIGNNPTRQFLKRQPHGHSPSDITIEDWELTGGGQISVHNCANLTMRRITLNGTQTPLDSVTGAALVLRENPVSVGGAITGVVSSVSVRHSTGMGVAVEAGPDLALEDISVDGFGADMAEQVIGVSVKPRPGGTEHATVGKVTVSGGPAGARTVEVTSVPDPDPVQDEKEQRRERRKRRAQ